MKILGTVALACMLVAFVAACILLYHKDVNVVYFYEKGMMEIWKRVENIM